MQQKRVRIFRDVMLTSLLAMLLVACVPSLLQGNEQPELAFEAHISADPDGETVISLGVENVGDQTVSLEDAFQGTMSVVEVATGAEAARSDVVGLDPLPPGETAFPAGWRGHLAPGDYRLNWGAGDLGGVMLDFTVEAGRSFVEDVYEADAAPKDRVSVTPMPTEEPAEPGPAGEDAPQPVTLLEAGQPVPASDPVDVREGRIEGDELVLEVSFAGGCQPHDFDLLWQPGFEESNPVQATVHLAHDGHGDMCEALLTETVRFDLAPLRDAWQEMYGPGEGTIEVDLADHPVSVDYDF